MLDLCDEILRRLGAGETVALCTVVQSRGSTPQGAGAKMLVLADGRTVGTLGGGCVEAEVRRRTLEVLLAAPELGPPPLMTFRLDHDYGWDDGLICGGIMDVAVEVLSAADRERFRDLADDLRENREAAFEARYRVGGESRVYREAIPPTPSLLIAGAGHVGQALAALAGPLGFRVAVVDDRPDCLSDARFPTLHRKIVGDIEAELRRFPVDGHTYVVIVTRGHRHDGAALAAVVGSPARYVGLIGSKRKIRTILGDLAGAGVPRECLAKVHAPVGLEIGAVTPGEIAISIAAELVAARRGALTAGSMKMGAGELDAWLDRDALKQRSPHVEI